MSAAKLSHEPHTGRTASVLACIALLFNAGILRCAGFEKHWEATGCRAKKCVSFRLWARWSTVLWYF
jgi:hypothetical protein